MIVSPRLLVCMIAIVTLTSAVRAQTFKVVSGVGSVGKDSRSYSPIKTGGEYPLGWWAKTTDAPLKMELSPGNVIRLLPRSEVKIAASGPVNAKFHGVLTLKSGKIEFDLSDLNGGKLDIETPTAVCGAAGARFQFMVDGDSGAFQVSQGRIYAKAKGDSTFAAESVGGNFRIAPGTENSYASGTISGTFLVNGRQFSGTDVSFQAAKGRGASCPAAIQTSGGRLGPSGPGNYFMEGGTLHLVDKKNSITHAAYLVAARDEGALNVKRENATASGRQLTPKQDEQTAAAIARATDLRKKLFPQQP